MRDFNDQRRCFLACAGQGMVLLSAAALGACGGGGGDDPGSGGAGNGGGGGGGSFGGDGAAAAGTPGTPVDTAQRASTLASVRDTVAGLASGAATFNSSTLAQALLALPALERVGISAALGNVWAKFTDGQFLVVPNNLDPAATAAGRALPATLRQARALSARVANPRKQAAAAGEFDTPSILTGQQYRQLDMLGQVPFSGAPDAAHLCQDFVDATTLPNLRKMAVGRGFTLPAVQVDQPPDVGFDNGVAGLTGISGDGVFFITASAAQVGNDATPRTVICTGTLANEANLARHAADLASGLLVHAVAMRGVAGVWQPVACLAIGPEFAELNWRFPTECIGIFNLTGGARLSDWIVPLDRAGLNHVMGWEQPVSWQRQLAFADDLIQFNLATNNLDGRNVRQAAEPKLRAYGMGETLSHLISRGLTAGGAPFYLQEATPALLVNTLLPTIDRALFREGNLEFELVGQFGREAAADGVTPRIAVATTEGNGFSEPLLARAADAPLGGNNALRSPLWEGGLLQTVLNVDDLARGGYVQVFNGGRCSNVVPITHWEIPFQVVTTIDELTLTVTLRARLRADVHGWRLEPDDQARNGAFSESWQSSVNSRADYAATGTISQTDTTRTTTTITWSGAGSIGNAVGAFFVNLSGTINWDTRRMSPVTLSVTGGGAHQQRTLTEQRDSNGEIIRRTDVTGDVPVTVTVAGLSQQGLIELAFDEQWALQAGQFDLPEVDADILPAPPQRLRRTRVSWPQVVADFPPRQDYGGT